MNKDDIMINQIDVIYVNEKHYIDVIVGISVRFNYNKHEFITRLDKSEFKDINKISVEEIKDKIIEVINS